MNNLAINTIFKKDPTRTLTLRNRFVSDMTRRFKKIQKLIYQSIVENDCFGLFEDNVFPFPSSTKIRVMEAAKKGQFAFSTTEEKVKSFMAWLREQDDNEILEVTEREGREIIGRKAWRNMYIDSAYKQGILRAQLEMGKIGIPNAKRPLDFAFFRPIHADRVGLIYTRTFESLKTVTQVMEDRAQKILIEGLSTGLARGIAEGKNPLTIARELTRDINREGIQGIGINRARMIARTEVIRAHHVAGINEYREAAIEGVAVQAEWGTAGWNVCSICRSLEGQVFSLDEIEPMIPRHPNCRCVAIPVVPVVPGEVEEEKVITEKMWIDSLSVNEQNALSSYMSEDYEDINEFLRGQGKVSEKKQKRLEKTVDEVNKAINKYPSLAKDMTVYRGVRSLPKDISLNVGSIIEDKGLISTSKDKDIAKSFIDEKTDTIFRIKLKEEFNRGAYLGNLPFDMLDQEEFLISNGTKMRVEKISIEDGIKTIDLSID